MLRMTPKSFALCLLLSCALVGSGQDCQFFGEKAFDFDAKMISAAPTCAAAAAKMHACAWGSSADASLAPIPITKCEKQFLTQLSDQAKQSYYQEMQLCAYESSRAEGTMAISEAALCQVDVAADFAAHTPDSDRAVRRASFDCAKATTTLEKMICSDQALGNADIVLSKIYGGLSKQAGPIIRPQLVKSEQAWLRRVPSVCGLSAPSASLAVADCIRNQFEIRFTDLDGCYEETAHCLKEVDSQEAKAATLAPISKPRASFGCDEPSTALQIVICADARLGDADLELSKTYTKTKSSFGPSFESALQSNQDRWLKFVTGSCPLGVIGGIPPLMTRLCVRSAFETRTRQLQACSEKNDSGTRLDCLDHFKLVDDSDPGAAK